MKPQSAEYLVISDLAAADEVTSGNFNQNRELEDNEQILALLLSQICDRQADKIKSLEQVFETSEHQLRHLLSVVVLYAETLHLGLDNHPLQEQAAILKNMTRQLRQHLNQLAAKKQLSFKFQTIDLRQIFQASLQELNLLIKQKQLKVNFPEGNALIKGDFWQIKQIFDNLLSNAIDFAPSATSIDCIWQVFQQEVLVEISDRGCGFTQEALQQALNPHYTTREHGTGLGLTIAQQIVTAHHGRLWVDNLPTGGALISFVLPRNLSLV